LPVLLALTVFFCAGGVVLAYLYAGGNPFRSGDAAAIGVVEPTTLGGRAQVTEPEFVASISSLQGEISNIPGTTASVGALYGDPAKRDLVMIAAGASRNGSTERRFEEFARGIESGGLEINNLSDTDPGPFGGMAKCGDATTSDVPMGVCIWSDSGSIGMVALFFRQKSDAVDEFISIRNQIERSG
jgi:hypothetical protein